jgi:DNA-binding transcriptional LysR family regulator
VISSHHLTVFDAVAREGSLGAAAHALGCTQSTVSHHLAALETQLNTTLFVRGRRGVELTDRGRVLRDHAELILSQLVTAERAVHDSASLREGMLRLGTFATAGATFVPQILRMFRKEHPGVEVQVIQDHVSIDEVRAGRLDVGIVSTTPDYWVRPIPGVSLTRLFTDPLLLAVPAHHAFASRSSVSLSELASERWITTRAERDPMHALLVRAARDAGFELRISAQAHDHTVRAKWIGAGLGIGLVPGLAAAGVDPDIMLIELAEPLAREVSAVTLADGRSVTAMAFMRLLRRTAALDGVRVEANAAAN